MIANEVQAPAFLHGGGQMGSLARQKDWSKTPLGSPDGWPQSLRTSVSLLLNSQFPMFIWWGKELTTVYNDAYIPVAGEKHPDLLGQPGKEAWSEIWEDLGPLVESVFAGQSTWSEDQVLYMNRHGYVEETYFTFSYSPVLDESGQVGGLFCACIETTDKVLATRRIQESERNLRNTILQSPVAMSILKGPSYVVEIANERMFELWGRGAEELLRRPIFDGLPEARYQGLEELLHQVCATGERFTASERPIILPRDGKPETVYLNFVYEPFREGDGTISGIIAVATDVTEQVLARRKIEEVVVQRTRELAQANETLVKNNQELKHLNTNLEEFAYAASHDMKEPVRKIHFFSDRLKSELGDKLSESQLRLFERLEDASRRMGTLIDDLLAYSQATRGVAKQEEIDLNRRVHRVLEDLDLEVQQKGATISVDPLPVIKGNKRQMQQLLQNLLSNALKYSKPGIAPHIRIAYKEIKGAEAKTSLPVDRTRRYHLLEVADNGIGFEQSNAERIFNVFTRLHGNAEYKGTGVGLSIVRKVVENHNGFVWAESTLGEGAVFKVLLPVN
ncbi:MAG TPA: ATP-binding protein [Chitinophagaceae bacterium]